MAGSDSKVLMLAIDSFHKLIGGYVEDVIVKNLKSHEVGAADYRPK